MRQFRRSRFVLLAVAVAIGWWGAQRSRSSGNAGMRAAVRARGIVPGLQEALAKSGAEGRMGALMPFTVGPVVISGNVVDANSGRPVGNVEVVFRSPTGEETINAAADGSYQVRVPAGMYRAFVRDDRVLSVARPDRIPLPGRPSAAAAAVPDEALMPIVLASHDVRGIDLSVMRAGTLHGRVVDRGGQPIRGAVVRVSQDVVSHDLKRPVLGTDVAESDAEGKFEMRMPEGVYDLEATHARYAGITGARSVSFEPGKTVEQIVTMAAGCTIAGRVVDARGQATSDGAIEKQWGPTAQAFAPTGRIEADGSFRWGTTEEAEVTLRAWPWRSPPSLAKQFACQDGARFENVVFQLPDRTPEVDGVLFDADGAPVPFAYVDLARLDEGGSGHRERTDAQGHWQVFNIPAGQYQISAQAPGHGAVNAVVIVPSHDHKLVLGGTGRVEGTTTRLVDGSFELTVGRCSDNGAREAMPHVRTLVTVSGGRFSIEDLPACRLLGVATWRGHHARFVVNVPAGGAGHVELNLGPARSKTIHGLVRDEANQPMAGATVTATYHGDSGDREVTVVTDAGGHYALSTFPGAWLVIHSQDKRVGAGARVADGDEEQPDLVFSSDAGPPGREANPNR